MDFTKAIHNPPPRALMSAAWKGCARNSLISGDATLGSWCNAVTWDGLQSTKRASSRQTANSSMGPRNAGCLRAAANAVHQP